MLDRRTLLAAMAVAPIFPAAAKSDHIPLAMEARHVQMLFGCAVRADQIFADRDFQTLVLTECAEITPELELKWDYIEPIKGQYNFSGADALADLAARTQLALHGHTLLWHDAIPPWAIVALEREADWASIERYFVAILPRYQTTVSTWDVVNEPIDVMSGDKGYRTSPFYTAFGPDYVARAFVLARQYAPTAKLFINEYGLVYDTPESRDKRAALIKLIDALKGRSAPLNGIGVQAHLELDQQHHFNADSFAAFLNEIGRRGLEIRISELDVKENQTELMPDQRDERAANAVRDVLAIALSNRAVGTVTSWGLSDRYSWLPEAGGNAGYNRGLPFDTDLEEKSLYRAIRDALRHRQK